MTMTVKFGTIVALLAAGCTMTFIVMLLLHANLSSMSEPSSSSSSLLLLHGASIPRTMGQQSSSLRYPSQPVAMNSNISSISISSIGSSIRSPPLALPQFRRFPLLGTKEFAQLCPWALLVADEGLVAPAADASSPPCAFYASTSPKDSEGISAWTAKVAQAFLFARQAGCQIYLDYGKGVDIQQVVQPWPHLDATNQLNNWTVPSPSTFKCKQNNNCSSSRLNANNKLEGIILRVQRPLVEVPDYRFVHYSPDHILNPRDYQNLTSRALFGFNLEYGMACSLGTLFHLSPQASQFEPKLFSHILPKLHNPQNLVMALYIRSGLTDNTIWSQDTMVTKLRRVLTTCALPIEQQYLSGSKSTTEGVTPTRATTTFSRVIWMLVTDSPAVKDWMIANYNASEAKVVDSPKQNNKVIPREVLTTVSRGAHSKPKGDPSVADFADAFIDWYLIGESDFVVSFGGLTFSSTASQRTARPTYWSSKGCSQGVVVHEEEEGRKGV